MNKLIVFVLFALLSLSAQADVKNLDNAEIKQMMAQGVPVIDIRRPDEWKQTGVIKGSHLLTFFDRNGRYDLDGWLQSFNKIAGPDKPFILICRSGNRTGQLSYFLDKKLHFTQVSHAAHGMNAWRGAGEPTVAPE